MPLNVFPEKALLSIRAMIPLLGGRIVGEKRLSKFPKLFNLRDVDGSEISLGTSFSRELSGDGHFEASFERG